MNFHLNLKVSKYTKFSKLEFVILVSYNVYTSLFFLMILAYLGQTPEVPRTDLRAKHHS